LHDCNGADRGWLIMQPAELDDLYRVLARVAARAAPSRGLSAGRPGRT